MKLEAKTRLSATVVTAAVPPKAAQIIREFRLKPPKKVKSSEGVRSVSTNTFVAVITPDLRKQIERLGFSEIDDFKSGSYQSLVYKNDAEGLTLKLINDLYKGKMNLSFTLHWDETFKGGSALERHAVARKMLHFPPDKTRVKRFKSKVTKAFRLSSGATVKRGNESPIHSALKQIGFQQTKTVPVDKNNTYIVWQLGPVTVREDVTDFADGSTGYHKFTLFTPG